MDRFSEQLVKKATTSKDVMKQVALALAAAVLLFLDVYFIAGYVAIIVALAVAAAIIWGLVWIIQGLSTEYEYAVTNDDLDIDKIMGRRKRKRLITISLRSVISIAPYTAGGEIVSDVVVMAHDETGEDMYCLICNNASYGKVAVIFNPDGRTLYNMIGGFSPEARNAHRDLYDQLCAEFSEDGEEENVSDTDSAGKDNATEE